jgi:hypothetical protein
MEHMQNHCGAYSHYNGECCFEEWLRVGLEKYGEKSAVDFPTPGEAAIATLILYTYGIWVQSTT